MKKLLATLLVIGAIASPAAAQSPSQLVFKVMEEADCVMDKDEMIDVLTAAGIEEDNAEKFMLTLVASGKVKFDAATERYTLAGYGECA